MASEEEKRAVGYGKKTCSPSDASVTHEQLLEKNAQLERSLAECAAELNEAKQRLQEETAKCKKLQEELSVFQMLVENAPDNIARHDRQCRYVYVNRQLTSTTEMTADAFIGKAPVELLPGDSAIAAYQACMQKVLESGEPQDFELLLPNTGQGVGYHHIRIVAEFDENGEVVGVIAIGRDVTDSKRFALDLAKREREFRTLAENLPDNIARYDQHCRLVYMNSNLEALQGLSLNERMGKMPEEVSSEPFYLDYQKLLTTTIETGQPNEAVLELMAQEDSPQYHRIHFVAERGEHDEIIGALAIGRDVTKDKQIERELHMLNCALDQAFDATDLIDADLRFRYVNEAAVRELGYSRDEFSMMTLLDIDSNVTAEMMQGLMKQTIEKGGVSNTIESFHRRKNGEVFPIEVGATAFCYEGEYLHLTTVRNISERKQAEQELYRHREQLEELVRERTADLQESRASLAEAQRVAHVGSWEMNLVDNVLTWSDEIYRIFEIDPQAFGASYEAFMETVHPDDRDRLNRTYRNSLEKREPLDIEHRLLLADGQVKYVHERCETLYDEIGQALRSIGTVQDITKLKMAEQKLKQTLTFTDQLGRVHTMAIFM